MLPKVTISTDGACIPNPGNGGWAAIIHHSDGTRREISGGDYNTTNNKMEFRAIIEAIKCIKEPSSITVRTNEMWQPHTNHYELPS